MKIKKENNLNSDMDNVSSFFKYLYYRSSEFYKRKEGYNSSYNFSAKIFIIVIFSIHWATIIFLSKGTFYEKYINKLFDLTNSISEHQWIVKGFYLIIGFTLLYGITTILLGKKYDEIYNRYNQETSNQRKKRGWIIILYLFITFSLFGYSIYKFNQNAAQKTFINEHPIKINELMKELKGNKK